jgi:hypothetical protein
MQLQPSGLAQPLIANGLWSIIECPCFETTPATAILGWCEDQPFSWLNVCHLCSEARASRILARTFSTVGPR